MPSHVTAEIMRVVEPMHALVNEQRVQSASQDLALSTVENKVIMLETQIDDINSRSEVPSGAPPCYGVTCVTCARRPASTSPCGHSPTVVPGAAGASSSGVNDPLVVSGAVIAGNGTCHCVHVSELIVKVEKLEAKAQWNKDPWDKGGGAYGGAPAPGGGDGRATGAA